MFRLYTGAFHVLCHILSTRCIFPNRLTHGKDCRHVVSYPKVWMGLECDTYIKLYLPIADNPLILGRSARIALIFLNYEIELLEF
jgi:hypothetical protein